MSLEARIGLLIKWIIAIVLFIGLVIPFQIIWFLIVPFLKMTKKKGYEDKLNMHITTNVWWPIEAFGKVAKGFLTGSY